MRLFKMQLHVEWSSVGTGAAALLSDELAALAACVYQ